MVYQQSSSPNHGREFQDVVEGRRALVSDAAGVSWCDRNHHRSWRKSWSIFSFAKKIDQGEYMTMLERFIHLIETHSQELTSALIDRVQTSYATPDYKNVGEDDLRKLVLGVYGRLGDWLLTKDELDLERRYLRIGATRAKENIPFSQVAWVIVLVKDNLCEFLEKEVLQEMPLDAFGEHEIRSLLDHFFDRAIYYAAMGTNCVRSRNPLPTPSRINQSHSFETTTIYQRFSSELPQKYLESRAL
jgi:hypothetical protein